MTKLLDKQLVVSLDVLLMFTLLLLRDVVHDFSWPTWLAGLCILIFLILLIRSWTIIIKHFLWRKGV